MARLLQPNKISSSHSYIIFGCTVSPRLRLFRVCYFVRKITDVFHFDLSNTVFQLTHAILEPLFSLFFLFFFFRQNKIETRNSRDKIDMSPNETFAINNYSVIYGNEQTGDGSWRETRNESLLTKEQKAKKRIHFPLGKRINRDIGIRNACTIFRECVCVCVRDAFAEDKRK